MSDEVAKQCASDETEESEKGNEDLSLTDTEEHAEQADEDDSEDRSAGQDEETLDELEGIDRMGLVEALIFTHNEPIGVARLKQVSGISENELKDTLESIQMKYELEDFGFELVSVAGKYQFRTKAAFAPFVRKLKAGLPRKLSAAALETLAIIAYRQPIVKSDIENLRGVDATPTLKTLIERRIIKIVGHRASVGQPALYGTTDEFLKIFGLRSLTELPTLRDLKELDADPGEGRHEEADEEVDEDIDDTDSLKEEGKANEMQAIESDSDGEVPNQEPAIM